MGEKSGVKVALLSILIALLCYTIFKLNDVITENELAEEPIDFVVSWTNGSDPEQQELFRGNPFGARPRRWRDWGELRYCLRSIEMYAPWARKVYLVVNNPNPNHMPGWLNTKDQRIVIVGVADIFPDPRNQVPTANINAVEVNLHRIKGLSKRFIYMNNDWLILKPVKKSAFFRDSKSQWVFPSMRTIDATQEPLPDAGLHDRALLANARMLDGFFGQGPKLRLGDLHAPLPIDRDILTEMASDRVFGRQFEATTNNRFRSTDDVLLTFLYSQYVMDTMRAYPRSPLWWGAKNTMHFGISESVWRNRGYMALVTFADPGVMCLNDDVEDDSAVPSIAKELELFLETRWPVSSSFEKPDSNHPYEKGNFVV